MISNLTRIAFKTFGCRMNQAETAVLEEQFKVHGYKICSEKDVYDILIINTCTVTEKADQEIFRLIRKIHKNTPAVKIALTGCLTEIQRDKLLLLPGVNWVVGNEDKSKLPEIIFSAENNCIISAIKSDSFTITGSAALSNRTRVNIKIQDGCENFCSYCIIPYTRGKPRSRDFDDILKECHKLIKQGYKELVLTGINLGIYDNKNKNLIDLLKAMLKIADSFRIRISSLEPGIILNELIDLMAHESRICSFLHIPIQSGSDNTLKEMKRRYLTNDFAAILKKALTKIPSVSIGTDVIIGFPTETDDHFNETFNFLKSLPLSYFHVFSYSKRSGTASAELSHQVSKKTIRDRSKLLRELSSLKRKRFLERNIGQTLEVLFEEKKNGFWQGITDNYVKVLVKSEDNLKNKLLPVLLNSLEKDRVLSSLQ